MKRLLPQIKKLRVKICEIARRMYTNGFISSTDGNISAKITEDLFLCTPSNKCKGEIKPEEILLVNKMGEKVVGDGVVSSEFFTHLSAYEERSDVSAVIHAHPPFSVVVSLVEISLTEPVLPELIMTLGKVPTTDYATPGTSEGAKVIKPWVKNHNAIILKSHGVLTLGKDLEQAYIFLERVEHSAKIIFLAHLIKKPRRLNITQIKKLGKLGL
ncbi:MAG: class II aldolase/adducin family protein [Candidatus Hydrogenedentes bacterium]|nr:class II aldolase/adducin family protein [Candidatus Hydrogenedentota bacterium]